MTFIDIIKITFKFIEAHNGAVTAISTTAIAAYTIILTHVSKRQAKLTQHSIDLGRQEFIATHRPKITTRMFRSDNKDFGKFDDNKVRVFFDVANEGSSRAKITEIGTNIIYWIGPWTYGAKETRYDIQKDLNLILESGQEQRIFTKEPGFIFPEGTTNDATNFWYCVGYIKYIDDNNIQRKTGFCRKWNVETWTWEKEINDDWEYSY